MGEPVQSLHASRNSRFLASNNNQRRIESLEERSNVQLSEPSIKCTRGLSLMAHVP
jgi:hypothetical protein